METTKLRKRMPVTALTDPKIVWPAVGSAFGTASGMAARSPGCPVGGTGSTITCAGGLERGVARTTSEEEPQPASSRSTPLAASALFLVAGKARERVWIASSCAGVTVTSTSRCSAQRHPQRPIC